jgi:two-component system, OmpR family, phosphate regulon sensor histidine kinase PhoR
VVNPFRRRERVGEDRHVPLDERDEILLELDADGRVVAASRGARATLPELAVGTVVGGRVDSGEYEQLRAGFTAVVSHELRTPLARLLALLDTASLPGEDPTGHLDQARVEVNRMRELIDDVLFLSELETGKEVVSLGSTRVAPVLDEVLADLADSADRAGVALEVEVPPELELPLRARMLRVVLENLIANSLRYAGPATTCRITLSQSAGGPALTISDDGVGVDEQDLPRLFERFYRTDRARSSRGTGLGLAIVKHVVTSAGGTVEAEATAGGGLTIRCEFPA